jgi:hypothetical protein
VSFVSIILCVASERVIPEVSVYFVMTQSGNFWIHPRIVKKVQDEKHKHYLNMAPQSPSFIIRTVIRSAFNILLF